MISDIQSQKPSKEVVQLVLGGKVKFSAKSEEQKITIDSKLKGNIYIRESDTIDDFIMYAEISSLSFKMIRIHFFIKNEDYILNIIFNNSFILIKDSDIYFNFDLEYSIGDGKDIVQKSGKIVDGVNKNISNIQKVVPDISISSLTDLSVYQNSKKTTLVYETSFKKIFDSVLNDTVKVSRDFTECLNQVKIKSIVEVKEDYVTGFSSYLNSTIEDSIVYDMGYKYVINAKITNLGFGAKMKSKFPSLPHVSDYDTVTSFPKILPF